MAALHAGQPLARTSGRGGLPVAMAGGPAVRRRLVPRTAPRLDVAVGPPASARPRLPSAAGKVLVGLVLPPSLACVHAPRAAVPTLAQVEGPGRRALLPPLREDAVTTGTPRPRRATHPPASTDGHVAAASRVGVGVARETGQTLSREGLPSLGQTRGLEAAGRQTAPGRPTATGPSSRRPPPRRAFLAPVVTPFRLWPLMSLYAYSLLVGY